MAQRERLPAPCFLPVGIFGFSLSHSSSLVPGICPVGLEISESSSKEDVVFSCMAVAGIIMGAYWPVSRVGPL